MKTIISLDPGLHGGISISKEGILVTMIMPTIGKTKPQLDIHGLRDIFCGEDLSNSVVVFEKLGQIFKSSKATAFSMGYQSGVLEALCVGLGVSYHTIPPKEWQGELFKGITELKNSKGMRDTKAMALAYVKRSIVNPQLTFGRATKPHDGIVDAICIGEYARRKLNL